MNFCTINNISEPLEIITRELNDVSSYPELLYIKYQPGLPHELTSIVNLNELIKNVLTRGFYPSGTDSYELAKTILYTSSSVISFETVDFDKLFELDEIIKTVNNIVGDQKKKSFLEKKLGILLPLFLRCKLSEVEKDRYLDIVILANENLQNTPIGLSFVLMMLSNLILKNIQNRILILNSVEKIIEAIDKIHKNEEMSVKIFPYVLPRLAEILFLTLPECFYEATDKNFGIRYKLTVLIPKLLLQIACYYPLSFKNIPIVSLMNYLLRFSENNVILAPSYNFVMKYPDLSYHDSFASSIIALIDTFVLLYQLPIGNGSNTNMKRDILFSVLIKMCYNNVNYQTAAFRSLYNLSIYPMFKYIFEEFKKLIEDDNKNAISFYLIISNNNYSKLFNKFELKHKLSSKLNINPTFGIEIRSIEKLNQKDIDDLSTIKDLIRLTDGLLMKSDESIFEFVHKHQYKLKLTEYLVDFMKSFNPILDINTAIPFAKLSLDYLKLHFRMRPPMEKTALGFNVPLILCLYNNIILSSPQVVDKRCYLTPVMASLYIIRKKFAKIILQYSPHFFVIAFYYVRTDHLSLLDPLLFLLCDVLSINPSFYVDEIGTQLMYFINSIICTNSIVIFQVLIKILFYLGSNSARLLTPLINDLIKSFKKNEVSRIKRIMLMFERISANPEIKICFINNERISDLIKSSLNTIKNFKPGNVFLLKRTCNFLMNLLSPSLTTNMTMNLYLRSASETVPYECYNSIINSLLSFFSLRNDDIYSLNKVLLVLRFASENIFFAKEIVKNGKLFRIQDFIDNEIITNDCDFIPVYIEFVSLISNIDADFTMKFVGYDRDPEIFKKIDGKLLDDDYFNKLMKNFSKHKKAQLLPELSSVQELSRDKKYHSKIFNKKNSPMMKNLSNVYLYNNEFIHDEFSKDSHVVKIPANKIKNTQ